MHIQKEKPKVVIVLGKSHLLEKDNIITKEIEKKKKKLSTLPTLPSFKCWSVTNLISHVEKEHLFIATCYLTSNNKEVWLIENGRTNHMTYNASIFKELNQSHFSKITIGNRESLNISQNLLSVGQMVKRKYSFHFKYLSCTIFDPSRCELISIKMRNRKSSKMSILLVNLDPLGHLRPLGRPPLGTGIVQGHLMRAGDAI
ncbi:hypothetical protein CR513_22726, partial [Mucuna pruriens]